MTLVSYCRHAWVGSGTILVCESPTPWHFSHQFDSIVQPKWNVFLYVSPALYLFELYLTYITVQYNNRRNRINIINIIKKKKWSTFQGYFFSISFYPTVIPCILCDICNVHINIVWKWMLHTIFVWVSRDLQSHCTWSTLNMCSISTVYICKKDKQICIVPYRCVYMLLGNISVEKHDGRRVTLEICPKSI